MSRSNTLLAKSPLERALWVFGLPLLVAAFWLMTVSPLIAAPKADLWDRWTAHDAASTATIDHSAWDSFLKAYVSEHPDGVTRIAYGQVSDADRRALDGYLRQMTETPISSFNRGEQFAYWVNLYNAVTVRTILENYPVASIRDINDGFLSPGPWDRKLVRVEGQPVSLNDIESRILRPLWDDPRIHYAINCASVGCPNLEKTAYRSQGLESRLDQTARTLTVLEWSPDGYRELLTAEAGEQVRAAPFAEIELDLGRLFA